MMRNIETFPSKQMYPYLSLVMVMVMVLDERKVAEFYHNIDRRLIGLVKMTYFQQLSRTIDGVFMVELIKNVKC